MLNTFFLIMNMCLGVEWERAFKVGCAMLLVALYSYCVERIGAAGYII